MSHTADSDRPQLVSAALFDGDSSDDVEEDQEGRHDSSNSDPEELDSSDDGSSDEMEDEAMAVRQPGRTEASNAACLQQGGLWLQGLGASYWGGAPPRGDSEHRTSLSQYLRARELKGGRPPSHRFLRTTSRRLPHILKERELKGLEQCDKIFASAWLDSDRVITGTKDNQLLVWDVKVDRHVCLPSYISEGWRVDHCGIHSIAISPQGVIASGGQAPQDILLLAPETFRPQALLKGHSDWVFALAWLSPTLLVSGGRDRSVMVWDTAAAGSIIKPLQVRIYHRSKVRDLKVNDSTGNFATLSADGTLKFWDVEGGLPLSSVDLQYKSELVCMTCDSHLNTFAVGSESHLEFVDARTAGQQGSVASLDPGGSVRSLSIHEHVMTIGTGGGTISFLDLRTGKFLPVTNGEAATGGGGGGGLGGQYLVTGKGYLKRDAVFMQHFDGLDMRHTVYTHAYDPTNTKLFVGGGPLPVGLCGCYAAVW